MDRASVRATVGGLLAALAVAAALAALVGTDRVLVALAGTDLGVVLVVAACKLGWLAAWGLALRVVLGVLDVDCSPADAVLAFAGAAFANNVLPLAQVGRAPAAAFLVGDATDAEFETGLAAVASVDALNVVPSLTMAAAGLLGVAATTTVGPELRVVAGAVVVLGIVAPVAVVAGWRNRRHLERAASGLLARLVGPVAAVVPRVTAPTRADLAGRVRGFFDALERVARDRRGLALAVGYATLGWTLQALALWLTFHAVGHPVSPAVPLFVVPAGAVASTTPLPGGLGGVESVHVVILTAVTGVAAPVVIAAVLLNRVGGFWLTTVVGAAAVGAVEARAAG
jgi:uncharacterized protein (TIRG00374 family)